MTKTKIYRCKGKPIAEELSPTFAKLKTCPECGEHKCLAQAERCAPCARRAALARGRLRQYENMMDKARLRTNSSDCPYARPDFVMPGIVPGQPGCRKPDFWAGF